MLTLNDAKQGRYYKVAALSQYAEPRIVRRLLDLGFTPNEKVCVMRKSLTKQTLLVQIRGFCLSLRSNIAEAVLIEVQGD